MKIISFWSGPRNVSTALMYSFAQRPDTEVIDEPLYAHYLKTTEAEHPGKAHVMDEMENDGNKVLESIYQKATSTPILFLKNMAHHWVNLNNTHLNKMEHVFLIRDPFQMLPSLINQIPNPILRDTGLKLQVDIYNYLCSQGKQPVIIDAKELLMSPRNILQQVCVNLNIDFYEEMLSWPSGPKEYDGVWSKFWYQNVHKSIGFAPYTEKKEAFPERIKPLLDECLPYYNQLLTNALKNNYDKST